MNKKVILSFVFFILISFFAKAQAPLAEHEANILNEEKITNIIENSRKNGTPEWELQKASLSLHRQLKTQQQAILSGTYNQRNNQSNSTMVINGPCNNPGFEDGTNSGWTFANGSNSCCSLPCPTCVNTPGTAINTVVNASSTVAGQCTAGVDIYSGLSVLPPGTLGGTYSLLLNDASAGYKMQQASQTFLVSAANVAFTYEYALVLESGGHPANEQPYFHVNVTDLNTNAVIPCTEYEVNPPTSGTLAGWSQSTANSTVYWKVWTTVALDLQAAMGHNVKIEFTVSDCNQGGHFGYCYINANCNPNSITLTKGLCVGGGAAILTGPPGLSTYNWTGPVTGNSQNLSTSTPGNYTLTTTATGGCPSPSLYYNLTLNPVPTPSFTSSAPPCSGAETFTDASTVTGPSTITNWVWNYGDGTAVVNSTTAATQTHTYNPPGNYTVTLTDTTNNKCVASYSFVVNAGGGGATPVFTSNSPAASPQCLPGNNVVFTNSSTSSGSVTVTGYSWNFGDGSTGTSTTASPNTSHSYTASGTYVVTLTVNVTGCSAVTTQTVVINPVPTATISAPTVCLGNATVFSSTITPATGNTYNWNFGDGGSSINSATPSHTYGTANTFPVTVTVTATGGCTVTATTNAIVSTLPTASFTVAPVCQGTASHFDATASTPASGTYNWSFGGAAPNTDVQTGVQTDNHTYSTAATFPVTLLITVGTCSASVTNNAVVNPMPTLGFTTSSECDLTAVPVTNTTAAQGTFTVWAWDFGDGIGTSASANPGSYTYPAPGVYTITLNASTSTGCSGTVTQTVAVHPNPQFGGAFNQPCLGDVSGVYDLSTVTNPVGLNDAITQWNWTFGDGQTASTTVDSVNHVYATCGAFNLSYTVSTNFNCTASGSAIDSVYCIPSVTAPPSFSICPGLATTPQTFTTTNGNNEPAGTVWFTNYPLTNTGMTIADTSGYNVFPGYATIPNNFSCNPVSDMVYGIAFSNYCIGNIDSLKITVYPTPYLSHMDSIKVCANQQVVVPSFTACPATSSIAWTNNTPSIGLAASGNGNLPSPFTGLNSTPNVVDGLITATPTANGCVGPDSTFNIVISPLPQITSITSFTVCPTNAISTPVINTIPTSGVNLSWTASNNTNIGMPASGTNIPPGYTAPANGSGVTQTGYVTYTPTLNGCVGPTRQDTISIKPTPVIQPISDQSWCPGSSTSIVNSNITPAPTATDVTWSYPTSLGNLSNTGLSLQPIGPLVNPGSTTLSTPVTVTYTVNGCVGIPTVFSIYVFPTPTASFSWAPVCEGQAMNFTDLSTPNSGTVAVSSWAWDMNNDGIYNDASTQNPSYAVTPAGQDPVSLFVTTVNSCTAVVTQTVTVYPNPVPNFAGDTLSGCPILHVDFTDASTVAAPSTITSYSWNFGAGAIPSSTVTTSATTTLSPVAYNNLSVTAVKSYTVSLTVISTGGCTATKTKNGYINVSPTPKADFDWGPKNADIDDPAITFVNQAVGAGPYVPVTYGQYGVHYYLGDTHAYLASSNYVDNNTTFNHSYDYYQPETYTVTQWVINSLGCKDSIKKEVTIGPNFTFYIPNAFSPNGDGTNEGFKGTGIGIKEGTYNLWVFDRWGNMLFYSDDLEKAWDGHMKGNNDRPLLQEDVYVWKVNFHDFTGKKHDFHGTVTLIK